MNSRSTQRFIGLVVALVASILVLVALPRKPRDPAGAGAREPGAAAAEAELPVFELQDGWWVLPRYGVRLRLPSGWVPSERFSRPFAQRDPAASLAGNLNVLSLPNFFGLDLEGIAEENRRSLAAAEALELIALEEQPLADGHPALRIDYGGSPKGQELHLAALVFLHGPDQIVITAAATVEEWPEVAEELRASFASVELLPGAAGPAAGG
jgi:hypothetical protein